MAWGLGVFTCSDVVAPRCVMDREELGLTSYLLIQACSHFPHGSLPGSCWSPPLQKHPPLAVPFVECADHCKSSKRWTMIAHRVEQEASCHLREWKKLGGHFDS